MLPLIRLAHTKAGNSLSATTSPYKPRKRTNSNSTLILTDHLKQVLIGLTLGDLSVEKATPNSNVRLRFDQSSLVHSAYLMHLYDLFKDYTLSPPKSTNRKPDNRTGKVYNSLIFKTRMLPCFNYLWELFYKDRVKIVPMNIGELLTPIGLAYWIMDDGGLGSNGELILHTHSYTTSEIERLIIALKDNFGIHSSKKSWTMDVDNSQKRGT